MGKVHQKRAQAARNADQRSSAAKAIGPRPTIEEEKV